MVALLIGHRLCCFHRQRSVILSNSLAQSESVIYDLLRDMFTDSPALAEMVRPEDMQKSRMSVPSIGNVVDCLPCNARTLQGRAVTGIGGLDEVHAALSTEALSYLTAQVEAVDAQVAVASQAGPNIDANPMWVWYNARDKEPTLFFDYLQEHVMPWAIALAERERLTKPEGEWLYQHTNAWGTSGWPAWSRDLLEVAADDCTEPQDRREYHDLLRLWGWNESDVVIGRGFDRSGVTGLTGKDRSAWVTAGKFFPSCGDPQFRIMRVDVLATGAEREVLEVEQLTREIFGRPVATFLDQYNTADLADKLEGGAEQIPQSPQRQQGQFGLMTRLLQERRLRYPRHAGKLPNRTGLLHEEMSSFEIDTSGGALVRWGTQKGHDDTVYAAGLALIACDRR